MYDITSNNLSASWDTSILEGKEVAKSGLATFIFGVSTLGGELKEFCKGMVDIKVVFQHKEDECLQILTKYPRNNGIK